MLGKKGLQMTTNTLVALAIAIIILLALVSMLMGIVPPVGEDLGYQADFRLQCNRFVSAGGCDKGSSLDPIADGYVDKYVARNATGTDDETVVKNSCCGREGASP